MVEDDVVVDPFVDRGEGKGNDEMLGDDVDDRPPSTTRLEVRNCGPRLCEYIDDFLLE